VATKQVNYEIRAGVTGRESITGLADDLEDVAKVLEGELSQQAKAAASRLRELATQDAVITAFNRLQSEARDAGRALKAAETEAANYAKQIAAAGPPTAQEAANLQRLRTAADGARATFDQQKQALSGAQAELQRYGIAGQNAQAAQQRLRQEVAQVRDSVKGIAPAYEGAAAGAQNAGGAMNRTHRQIGDGVESISGQLRRLQGIYAAFQGLQGMKSVIGDLADTADAYNNLQGRIRLATGEGEAFNSAFAEVTEISIRTNSNLEQTGQLFAKLTEAGKSAGLSAQQAISQALGLTETINQAIQLSGGSADSAKAAVTQLVQGLQGGVLRGDEFNSVMEQSPRLAKALADGLGVTTGELRKMAEAGSLSADTVMSALKGQADTLKREFGTLPATVGRALENLSTNWTVYIGETDKATGASSLAAGAIGALARNLDTVAGLLIDAGQAAAAFAALKLAQHFAGIGVAATQSAVSVAAHTAAVTAAGAAGTTAAANVGRFASILSGLKTFTLLGIVTNFKDIGTAIGETLAKLAGYKDRSDEIARADKTASEIAKQSALDRQTLAAMTQAAIDKQFELSKGAQAAIAVFDGLRAKGESAADAIAKIGKDVNLASLDGIRDFSAVLDKLAADGKLAASEVQAAWAQALEGKDLAQFEVMARAAFSGSAREAERLGQMLDATVREAVKRTGLDFDQLQGKVGAAARSAINDVEAIVAGLDRLKTQGVDTGRTLTASLGKAINTADSQQAIDLVMQRIEQLRSKLGETVTNGLLDQARDKARQLKDGLDAAMPGINSVAEAMKNLGITSDEALKKTAASSKEAYGYLVAAGTASARELALAFKKAADEAIAANNGVAPSWVAAQAAARGYEVQVDAAGKATVRAAGDGVAAVGDLGNAYRKAGDAAASAAERATSALERQNAVIERQNAAVEKSADLERKRQGVDKSGFSTDKSGNTIVAGGDLTTLTGIAAFLKAAGVDDDKAARDIAREFSDSKGDIPYFSNPGQMKYAGANSTMSQALLKAAERYTFGAGTPVAGAVGAPRPSTIPEPAPRTVNVNLSLNNTSYGTVATDDAGVATLQRLMEELQRAKAAAGS
jgi:tape measure domain-containing protein